MPKTNPNPTYLIKLCRIKPDLFIQRPNHPQKLGLRDAVNVWKVHFDSCIL